MASYFFATGCNPLFPFFIFLLLSPNAIRVQKWGLWEVTRSRGWSPQEWGKCPPQTFSSPSATCGHGPPHILELQTPPSGTSTTARNKSLLFLSHPVCVIFVITTPTG